MKEVTVLYFAQLAVQAGRTSERRRTAAASVGELFDELQREHPWSLPAERLRFARNDDFCPAEEPLVDGDTLAIMPPMSGG